MVVRLSGLGTGRLYPQVTLLILISVRGWVDPRAIVLSEGLCQWKIPMTPSGIEPETLRFVAQHRYKLYIKVKVKWPRYRPGVAQRVGRGIALLFHDRGTRRGWVVSSTPRPHFTPGKGPVLIFTGGWVGPRAGLDGRKILSPPRFDPGPSSP